MPGLIDLHTHSTASDGSDSPSELMAMAARAGLSAVALTDHDTVEGLAEAQAAADDVGVRLIQGCELSCEVDEAAMHLLVYFLADGPGPLQDRLGGLQEARSDRNRRIVDGAAATMASTSPSTRSSRRPAAGRWAGPTSPASSCARAT